MHAARRTVLAHLTRFLDEQRLSELSDADLLERFVTRRDDASLTTALLPKASAALLALLALGGLILGVGVTPPPSRVEVRKAAPPVPPIEEPRPTADRHGDPLPEGALARLGTVRFRQGGEAVDAVLSRDGNLLATGGGGFDGKVRLWDTRTGKLIRDFPRISLIFALALSPDGGRLACSTTHRGVRLFDVKTGKDVTPPPVPPGPQGRPTAYTSLAFSPDGKLLAGVAYGVPHLSTHVWRVSDNERLHSFPTESSAEQMRVLSFSADGKLLGTGGGEPAVWDLTTGKCRVRFKGVKSPARCAALSPDGKTMAVGYQDRDGSLYLWDTTAGKVRAVLKGPERQGAMTALAFAGDGKTLFSTGEHQRAVHQWDVKSGKGVRTLPIEQGDGQNVGVSADGKTLAVAGGNHAARVWKAKPGGESGPAWEEFAFSEAHQSQVMGLAFSPDGKTLASTCWHGPALLWDVPSRKQIASQIGHAYGVYSLAFAPDGKALVLSCKDGIVRWCNPRTGSVERSLPWEPESYSSPAGIGFRDGKTLVAGYSQKNLHLADLGQAGKPRPLPGNVHIIDQIRFSQDGRTLATSSNAGKTILLWDTVAGRQTRKIDGVVADWVLALSADGKVLAARAENASVRLWDLDTGKERAPIRGHPDRIVSLTFSPDGRWLASSCGDNAVRLWETASGTQAGLFRGHLSQAKALAFSPDGRILASGSDDTSILLWDVSDRFAKDRPTKLTRQRMEALWVDLAGDAEKARHATWTLARSPRESVPFLRERLVLKKLEPQRTARLIAELDDDSFAVRDRATRELQSLDEAAGPAMRKALEAAPSAEVKLRLRQAIRLLDQVKGEPKRLRDLRARAALDYAGTTEARRLLDALPKE